MSDEDVESMIRPTAAYRTVRARWWVVILTGVLCGVLTLIFSSTRTKYYDATAELFLGPGGYSIPVASSQPSQRVNTLAVLACSDLVLEPAGQASGADLTNTELSVTCTPRQDAQVIDIVVRAPAATQAVQIAKAIADAFNKVAAASSPPITQVGASNTGLYPNSPVAYFTVRTPTAPSTPKPTRDAIFGTLFGAAASILLLSLYGLRKERVGHRHTHINRAVEHAAPPPDPQVLRVTYDGGDNDRAKRF